MNNDKIARVFARPIPPNLTEREFQVWRIAESERLVNAMAEQLREYYEQRLKKFATDAKAAGFPLDIDDFLAPDNLTH